jgi:hypothetical protein
MSMAARRSRVGTAARPGAPAELPAMGSPETPEIGNVRGWTTTAGRELTRRL